MLKNLLLAGKNTLLLPVGMAVDAILFPWLAGEGRPFYTPKIGKNILRHIDKAVSAGEDPRKK